MRQPARSAIAAASSQSVVLPIPAEPSSNTPDGPPETVPTNRSSASSSCSRPRTTGAPRSSCASRYARGSDPDVGTKPYTAAMAFVEGWDRFDRVTLMFVDPELERAYQLADQADGVR